MEKEFVPYEQAIKLKELGFDEKCIAYFFRDGELNNYFNKHYINSGLSQTKPFSFSCTAPLYQQAFDFLLLKLDRVSITYHSDQSGSLNHGVIGFVISFYSKEECLKRLIELVKNI